MVMGLYLEPLPMVGPMYKEGLVKANQWFNQSVLWVKYQARIAL